MENTSSQRYLRPTARGVFNWLGKPAQGLERRLFEALLLRGSETPFHLRALAQQMEGPAKDMAKALFALNRSESISLLETEPDRHSKGWGQGGLAELSAMLAVAGGAGQQMLLSTADGFPIARAGYGMYEAEVIAVQVLQDLRAPDAPEAEELETLAMLYLNSQKLVLSAARPIDRRNPVWVNIAYRLLSAFAVADEKEWDWT